MDFHVAVPGPFTYLVHEHARSIIAIQELQQEVTSLLEFREHVLEALPHLHHSRPFHSLTPAPTHDPPPAPRPAPHPNTTRAESSPSKAAHAPLSGGEGARQARAISAGGGGGGGNSSSSSTGGKSLSETHSSSAVADSGFSTDKAGGSMGKSSSSSAGEHLSGADDPRWTCVEPDPPLGSAEDELWHLLDVIQRKGTRLRHDLERAERCERDRLSAGPAGGAQGAPHHPHHHLHHHHHHPAAPASDPLSSPRHPHPAVSRDYWPHSLPGHTAADLLPPPPPPPPVGVALEAEAWAAVDRLRQDRQYLIGRVGWAEAEAAASHQRLVDLHGQLLALAGDKRRLEDQVRALRLADPPTLPAAVTASSCATSVTSQSGAHTVTIVADHTAATTTTTTTTRPRRPSPAVTVSVAGTDGGEDGAGGAGRARVRSASSVRLNADRERDVVLPRVLKVPIKERAARTSTTTPAAPAAAKEAAQQDEESRRGSDRVVIERERRAGRADGGLSMPVSLLKGARLRVTPNKQRISAILREKDVLELQRQLLTTVMEAEVLKKQIESASEEWASKTSEWEADHRHALAAVTSLKEENSRLKQQLESRPKAAERRDVGVCAAPVMFTTSTMTGSSSSSGAGEDEDAPTHTVHAGPNVKYDVVVHDDRRGDSSARRPAAAVEKPPRRSREPRSAPSPAPPLRETAESPGGKDSLGRAAGARGRGTLSQSGRCTPTGTPRSSPAPSITPRMCTARAAPQDARTAPLTRGTVTRATLHRRDSLKAAQAKGGKAAGGGGGGSGGATAGGGQAKVAAALSSDQGSVGQPRSMRQAPRSPLTLADLRTPSPAPPTAQATRPAPGHRGAKGVTGP